MSSGLKVKGLCDFRHSNFYRRSNYIQVCYLVANLHQPPSILREGGSTMAPEILTLILTGGVIGVNMAHLGPL